QDEEFIIILDIDKIFSADELTIVSDMKGGRTSSETEEEMAVLHA
ncbi:MAG: chemotaxis protein CheW, partial [Nitrospirae bacterium]|nr:chemotaxis protein CheW [Nitrospirota bacterium]